MKTIPPMDSFSPRKQRFMRWICKTNKKTKEYTAGLITIPFVVIMLVFILFLDVDHGAIVKPVVGIAMLIASIGMIFLVIEMLAAKYNPIVKGYYTFDDLY